MTQVVARPGESFESLIRRFKRSVERDGILSDLRKHEYYEKPSVRRKKKSIAARKQAAKRRVYQKPSKVSFKFNHDKSRRVYQTTRPNARSRTRS